MALACALAKQKLLEKRHDGIALYLNKDPKQGQRCDMVRDVRRRYTQRRQRLHEIWR